MSYRNLKQLRNDLQARLGFGSSGAAGNVNEKLLNSMLRQAHSDLYEIADWPELKTYSAVSATVASNGTRLAYPTNCNIGRIQRVSVNLGAGGSDSWREMKEGIADVHYSVMTRAGWPQRYARFSDGVEVFPYRDATYPLRVFYMLELSTFEQDTDRPSIRDGVVFLYALSMAKAHYRHPDAGTYAQQLEAVLAQVKRTQWGNLEFNGFVNEDDLPAPRPVVV